MASLSRGVLPLCLLFIVVYSEGDLNAQFAEVHRADRRTSMTPT